MAIKIFVDQGTTRWIPSPSWAGQETGISMQDIGVRLAALLGNDPKFRSPPLKKFSARAAGNQ